MRDPAHEAALVMGCQKRGFIRHGAQQVGKPAVALGCGEIHQHPFADVDPRSRNDLLRAADADPDPPVIRADMPVDVADAVMPAMPAAAFHPDLAGRQINLVIEDKYVLGRDLVETRCLGHGKAGLGAEHGGHGARAQERQKIMRRRRAGPAL